jgi:DNA-binding response OmpR family regulator
MPKVLLVEDDDDFRDALGRYLKTVGIQTVGADSVEDASEVLRNFAPDVVILDINLPGEDGFSALARLRQESDLGLIMLTGRNETADRIRGLTLGADHYLAKPVNTQELEAIIRNLSNRLRAMAETG